MNWLNGLLAKFGLRLLLWATLAAFVAGAAGGAVGMHKWDAGVQARKELDAANAQKKRDDDLRAKYAAAATALEQKLAANAQETLTLKQRLKNATSKNPVYRSCVIPADGLRVLQDATAGR